MYHIRAEAVDERGVNIRDYSESDPIDELGLQVRLWSMVWDIGFGV